MSKGKKKASRKSAKPEQPPRPKQRMARPAPAEQSSPRILVYALLAVAIFMGLYLHVYALPQLTYFADGQSMPDSRITGYDAADITALRESFEYEAAGQLNFLHKTAGIIFPVAVFLGTWALFGLLVRGTWRWAVVAAAGVFAAVDITENFLIDRVLVQDPVDPTLVGASSALTTLSWALLALITGLILVFAVRDLVVNRSAASRRGP